MKFYYKYPYLKHFLYYQLFLFFQETKLDFLHLFNVFDMFDV